MSSLNKIFNSEQSEQPLEESFASPLSQNTEDGVSEQQDQQMEQESCPDNADLEQEEPNSDVTETNEEETESSPQTVSPLSTTEQEGELKALMEKLLAEFSGKLKYDAKKQEQIDQLYNENVAFREGLVEQYKRKLTLAVIEQIDDAEKQIAHFQHVEYTEANFRKILHSFEDLSLSFRDMLLERFDIESWQSEPDTPFDPRCQRTLRTTPTGQQERVKTLHQSIRYGYKTNEGHILRPEMVDVYVFDASLVSQEQTETGDDTNKTGEDE